MTRRRIFALTVFMCLIFSGALFAQETGENEHDGFFLRFQLGAGYQSITYKDGFEGEDIVFSGLAGNFSFQIGLAVINNFILFGELSTVVVDEPKFKVGSSSGTADGVTMSVSSYGGGFSYYFMPSNVYFTLSAAASQAKSEYSGSSGKSEVGFGAKVSLGKEWWVSTNWGLGIAAVLQFDYMKDKGDGETYDMYNVYGGIAFSATFN